MDKPAEAVRSLHAGDAFEPVLGRVGDRRVEVNSAARVFPVVVLDELPKYALEVAVQSCRSSFGHISIALVVLRRWREVYEPIIEVLAGDSVDRGGDRVEPAGTTREPGRERHEDARVVPTGAQMVTGYANEVGDVLGEQHVAFCHGGGHHVKVRPTGEPRLGHGAGVNAAGAEPLGQLRRVHFVEEQLQGLDAAAVSWRCSSIRASTSPGYAAR